MNVVLGKNTMIMWTLQTTFKEPGPYKFKVYRGKSPTDEFKPITNWLSDTFITYDRDRTLADGLNIDLWYKVALVTNGKPKLIFWSNPTHAVTAWANRDWLIAKNILRKELRLYTLKAGIDGVLLKPREYGEPCSCVDPSLDESSNPSCPLCYGTGVKGGYYPGTLYPCLVQPDKRLSRVDPNLGLLIAVDSTFRGLAFPYLQERDVLVDRNSDRRWAVGKAIQTVADIRGIPILASFPVKQIPLSDPVYQIDVSGVNG